jgi:hemoglobin/transferrin/lactoferrin receptor protein
MRPLRFVLTGLSVFALSLPAAAQTSGPDEEDPDTLVFRIDPILVTATRGPRAVTETPRPVSVLGEAHIQALSPNNVSDLFRDIPGLSVTGVGPNQGRPSIRGQRGQRILLLADGLRLNNSRRQRDFGELPALVDVNAVEQVEVVRGPASVLYGSDAIGGVVNIITRVPDTDGVQGTASYRYGAVEGQNRFAARVSARSGAFSIMAGGMTRRTDPYLAPAGSFGDITLGNEVTVNGSGIEDRSLDLRMGWAFTPRTSVYGKFETYSADDAGFGYVSPDEYATDQPLIDIHYPKQRFDKLTFGLETNPTDFLLADRFHLTVYGQQNDRDLVFQSLIPFGPDAGLILDNRNTTDIRTYGFRAEARKLVASRVLLTYGLDGYQDEAEGRDRNSSTIFGFGPPMEEVSTRPSIPDARFRSFGAFAQGEIDLGSRVSLVGGGRFQSVDAVTFETPDMPDIDPTSSSDRTFVAAINGLLHLTDDLELVVSTGRGFRSPNLVELFFDGAVAEAGAYQIPSEDLTAETSFNVDLGARYETGRLFIEGFYFRNTIYDGIRARPVTDENGDVIQRDGLDVYQNVNLDEILFRGFELNGNLAVAYGFSLGAGYSKLDAEDAIDPENPVGESYSEQFTGQLRWENPDRGLWAQWDIRHSGEQKSVELGSNPLGDVLPAFTVQNIRGGIRLFELGGLTHSLSLAVTNLTDELYAETANASFFRPEPKRNFLITYELGF